MYFFQLRKFFFQLKLFFETKAIKATKVIKIRAVNFVTALLLKQNSKNVEFTIHFDFDVSKK